MLFLVDEDVPRSVANFLRERSHEVREVTAEPGLRGKKDQVLAAIGDEEGAVLVTWNARDYKKISSRRSRGADKLRFLGIISFQCLHNDGLSRIQALIDSIEFEYAAQQRRKDKRLFIEIKKSLFRVLR